MICIEKKDILNGFATIKGKSNEKYLYFHIEVEKPYIQENLKLMVCTDTIKYFVMNLNKDTAEFNTEKKLVFNGKIDNIKKIVSIPENKISIAVFNGNKLIVAGYDIGISYPIANLPLSKEKLNVKIETKQIYAKEKSIKINNIDDNLNTSQKNNQNNNKEYNIEEGKHKNTINKNTAIKNDILDEVSLTKNSNKENILICEKNNAECLLKNKDVDILEKERELENPIKDIQNREKEKYLVPFNITINKNIDTTKDLRLSQSSELIKKMFLRATTSRELKDEPNNMIIFKITYTNFKKIALNENIYYIPINLIVSMLKKEIKLCERFLITIVFKKNSPYIKCIQIAIQSSNRNLNLDNLTNFKHCYDLSNNIGYWVFNYEP